MWGSADKPCSGPVSVRSSLQGLAGNSLLVATVPVPGGDRSFLSEVPWNWLSLLYMYSHRLEEQQEVVHVSWGKA